MPPPTQGKKQKQGKGSGPSGPSFKRWTNFELAAFQAALLQLGADRTEDVRREVRAASLYGGPRGRRTGAASLRSTGAQSAPRAVRLCAAQLLRAEGRSKQGGCTSPPATGRRLVQANMQDRSADECRELEAGMLRVLPKAAELAKQHEARLRAQRLVEMQKQPLQGDIAAGRAAAVGAAGAAADGEGEGGKPRGPKKPRGSWVQEELEPFVGAELQEAPPAVAHVSC